MPCGIRGRSPRRFSDVARLNNTIPPSDSPGLSNSASSRARLYRAKFAALCASPARPLAADDVAQLGAGPSARQPRKPHLGLAGKSGLAQDQV
jgi:hypothetical protein